MRRPVMIFTVLRDRREKNIFYIRYLLHIYINVYLMHGLYRDGQDQ